MSTARLFASPPWRASLLAAAVALGAWLLLSAWLPAGVFWITDEGNRRLQLAALEQHGSLDVGALWGGWEVDPQGRFFPRAGHHFLQRGREVVSFYPPYLVRMTAPLVPWFGERAVAIWPLLGLVATAALFPFLLAALGVGARTALAAALLPLVASPLLFYAVGFWEQPVATAFATVALLALLVAVRRGSAGRALLGGVLLGATCWLREEGYVLAAAWGVGLLLAQWRERRHAARQLVAAALGFLLLAVPLWVLQRSWWGSALGLHAVVYDTLDGAHSLVGELSDAWTYLFAFDARPACNGLLLALFAPAILLGLAVAEPSRRARTWAFALAALGALAALASLLTDSQPIAGTLHRQSLFPHAPILALAAFTLRRQATAHEIERRVLAGCVAFYCVALVWLLHRGDVGVIWGPRHFLPLFPALLALAVLGFEEVTMAERPGRERLALGVLLLAGVVVQLFGWHLLLVKREAGRELLDALREAPARMIVTDQFWLPEEMATLWGEKTFFAVDRDDEILPLLTRLRAAGERDVLVLLAAEHGPVSAEMHDRLARAAGARRRLGRPETRFLALEGMLIRLPTLGGLDDR